MLLALAIPREPAALAGIATIALIRLASIRWKITLPVLNIPHPPEDGR